MGGEVREAHRATHCVIALRASSQTPLIYSDSFKLINLKYFQHPKFGETVNWGARCATCTEPHTV